jgi:hypothetical protein
MGSGGTSVPHAQAVTKCWMVWLVLSIGMAANAMTSNETCTTTASVIIACSTFELLHCVRYYQSFDTKSKGGDDEEQAVEDDHEPPKGNPRMASYCCVEELFLLYLLMLGAAIPTVLVSECPDFIATGILLLQALVNFYRCFYYCVRCIVCSF